MHKLFSFLKIFLMHILICANCERAKDHLYTPILGAHCYRRLNGTHQIGCSSKFSGSTGVLHLINSTESLNFIMDSPPAPPYAVIIIPKFFTQNNILQLKNKGGSNISAVVLINEFGETQNFSHDMKCPNQFASIQPEVCDSTKPDSTWNPPGTGLMYEDFPFPIFYVADMVEIDKIKNCYEKFNSFDMENQKTRSLCSIEINQFMAASSNSEVCMRRTINIQNLSPTKYCDPLQGRNIFATLFHREIVDVSQRSVKANEKFILVSCRLDTTSMFDGVGPGAMDSLISFATLVSLGHTLARILPEQKNSFKRNILFAVFNGESFDYIGSQRFVYDLERIAFPIKKTKTNPISLDQIDFMIDIGVLDQLDNIRLYTATELNESKNFIQLMQSYSKKFDLNINFSGPVASKNMPPTSAQSFLRHNISFPAIVVSSEPKNNFYHSIYDDSTNIDYQYLNSSSDFTNLTDKKSLINGFHKSTIQMKIRNVATALALGLYTSITNSEYTGTQIGNPILVDECLYCFLDSSDCPLFRAASYPGEFEVLPGRAPPMRYISVSGAFQPAAVFTYEIFGLLISQPAVSITKDNCINDTMIWYAGYNGIGECRLTTQHYSEALSPAFFIKDYDWKSGQYSTWTESTWQQFSARIYLRPSKIHDTVTLSIGFVVLILSFVIVFLINSRSDVLFGHVTATRVSQPAAC